MGDFSNTDKTNVGRRGFLTAISAGLALPASGALSGTLSGAFAEESGEKAQKSAAQPLVESFPVLQNPTPTSITAAWAVSALATGWVEWGTSRELGQTAHNTEFGLRQLEERFLCVPITGLAPNTTYFYRTATVPIDFKNAYKVTPGEPVYSDIYSFTTPGPAPQSARFAVMNDTHENQKTLAALTARIAEVGTDLTIWNGDLIGDYNSSDAIVHSILCPAGAPFAVEKPMLFTNGNHDHRGIWARKKNKALTPWVQSDPKFRALGRNFAVRIGPLALIGLDTGEDKPDAHPVFAGLAEFEPYRALQAAWLAETLESPEIASAPFVVAFCHIPLFDPDANANPGDILESFASWQRPSAKLWGPLFEKHHVPLLIAAHMHKFRYDEPTEARSWAQLVGGGPDLEKNATLIFGEIKENKLVVTAEKLADHSVLGTWSFPPRS